MINSKILSKNNLSNFLLFLNLVLIILSLWLFQVSDIDVKIQNYFFDFSTKNWFIDRSEPVKKFIFYQFPKIIFGILFLTILPLCIFSFIDKKNKLSRKKHDLLLIIIGLCLIPLIAGNVKKFTNIYCPNQLEIYGGNKPYVKIFDNYPIDFKQEKKGQCFPAGHVITGFSLYIFCFILYKKSQQILAFLIVTILGWILGFYQILKGAHFVSDTIVAMFLCLILAQLITKIYRQKIINKPFDLLK